MSLSHGEQSREYPDGRPLPDQPHWRQDFPTDIPEDDLVARREFTKFLVLTSGALVLGQCWIGVSSLLGSSAPTDPTELLSEADLKPGLIHEFRYPTKDDPCLLICLADGRPVAYGQKCTHLSCAVIPEPEKGHLRCPCHNGYFEINEGRPIAGPARRPLARIKLERRDGKVYATGVEERTV
jgi:nitrite reductase/ring-hydroxylating ferredoxin subunit